MRSMFNKLFSLFAVLAFSFSAFASTHVYKINEFDGFPIWGSEVVYNMEIDGGMSNHICDSIGWRNAMFNTISRTVYFPGNWTFSYANLGVTSNVTIKGDGRNASTFTMATGLTTSSTTNWFIGIGISNVTNRDFRILTRAKRCNAIFKFNSMGATDSTECTGINFFNVFIDTSFATAIKGGETVTGQTHHIVDLNVINCEIAHLGDPANPYTTADDAPQNTLCHGIQLGNTTWGGLLDHNYIHDCSGDGINSNLLGWCNAAGFVTNMRIGNFIITRNTIENTYSNVVIFGNWGHGLIITNNFLFNPTGNGEFCLSIEGIGTITDGNICKTWQGRNPFELYGAQCKYGHDVAIMYLGDHKLVATRRSDSRATTQMMLTGGYRNEYYQEISYDTSLGISANIPARRAGINISNQAKAGTQPLVWEGRNYPFGNNFHPKLSNFNAPAIYAENIKQYDVTIFEDCILSSPYISSEDVVRIAGQRWKVLAQIDATGSSVSSTAAAVSVNTTIGGTGYTDSYVNPKIIYLPSATKLKNKDLYSFKVSY